MCVLTVTVTVTVNRNCFIVYGQKCSYDVPTTISCDMLLWLLRLLLLLSRAQQYLKGVDSSFDSVQPLQLLPSQTSNYRTTTITMTNLTQKRDNSTTTGSEEVGSVGW